MAKEENKILDLAAEIERLTVGLCSVGIGPYGFGVDNDNPSELGIVIRETPEFFPDDPGLSECMAGTLTVEAYRKADGAELGPKELRQILKTAQDEATLTVARAVDELSTAPLYITRAEYESAYKTLADQEFSGHTHQMQMM